MGRHHEGDQYVARLPGWTTFILVRHGETEWNKEGRLQGRTDIPLNETGRRQCKQLAKKLYEVMPRNAFDKIYCSPLKRAHESACIMAEFLRMDPGGVIPLDELIEWNCGVLEGLLRDDIIGKYPNWWTSGSGLPEGAESLEARKKRLHHCFTELARKESGKRVLIVFHRGVLRDLFLMTQEIGKCSVDLGTGFGQNAFPYALKISENGRRWYAADCRWDNFLHAIPPVYSRPPIPPPEAPREESTDETVNKSAAAPRGSTDETEDNKKQSEDNKKQPEDNKKQPEDNKKPSEDN